MMKNEMRDHEMDDLQFNVAVYSLSNIYTSVEQGYIMMIGWALLLIVITTYIAVNQRTRDRIFQNKVVFDSIVEKVDRLRFVLNLIVLW